MSADLPPQTPPAAASFLACLCGTSGDDAPLAPVTFQTFTDGAPKPSPDPLAQTLHGRLDDLAPELETMNAQGAGVFIAVNATDGRGRKKANIRALRGWHADLDLKDAAQPFAMEALPLAPTIAVRTPGGWHLYWLAPAPMPCDDEARRKEHEAELKALAHALSPWGADPAVCQVAAVLRLPGYLHRKAEPRVVELITADGPRYSREAFRSAFPAVSPKPAPLPSIPAPPPVPCADRASVIRRAEAYLSKPPGGIQGAHGGDATFAAALKVCTRFDLTASELLELLERVHNPQCVPAWSRAELAHKAADAWKVAQDSPDLGCALRADARQVEEWEPGILSDSGENPVPEMGEEGPPALKGFVWKPSGLFKKGKDDDTAPSWIAPPFCLRGRARDDASQGWGLIMAWADPDGVPHEEVITADLLTGDGAELARRLGHGGLFLPPDAGARRHLLRYLVGAMPCVPQRVRLVETTGWQRGAYVMPDGSVIGQAEGEPVHYTGPRGAQIRKPTGGTLEGWQTQVAAQAVGEPYLAFALACAFAGPLMGMVRPDAGGGFNLQGFSSKGKSTVLECAASVWHSPHPLPTWRATSNGLEGIAASRNDGFLPLDELGQVDTREAGQTAYLLANGADKVRARREGGNREARTWRLIFLSSGEVGLEDRLNEDGRKAKAGQSVRVPDIPCPSSGMFMDAHGYPSMGVFAEALKRAAREHYGHAARRFLACLCEEWGRRDDLARKLQAMETEWMDRTIPAGVDPQVRRVGGRFALVAVAGELAREMGILPWPEGEASRAAAHCFRAWLDRRGHASSSETVRAVQAVIDFLGKHGASRFEPWGEADTKTINRAGWRKRSEGVDGFDYFLTPEGWKEATAGLNPRDAARACIEAGILASSADGKASQSLSIQGHGKVRAYVIRARGIAQYETGDTA